MLDIRTIRNLCKEGAPVNGMDEEGRIPILEAASEGHTKAIGVLHSLGADLDVANDEGQRAIHYAASNGHTETIMQLYDFGADPNVRNNYQETPMHLAAAEGARLRTLLFSSLLHDCLSLKLTGHEATLMALIGMGVDLNAKAEDDWTCLHWAASGGHDSVITMLVEARADVNMTNSLVQTPISAAVLAANISTIKTLVVLT